MGSKQRSQYHRKGKIAKRPGRHSRRRKKHELSLHTETHCDSFHITDLSNNGLHLKFCRDNAEDSNVISHQLLTDRHIFSVKKRIDDGMKILLTLQKKKIAPIEGYRLIDISSINTHVNEVCAHVSQCPAAIGRTASKLPSYRLISEVKRFGLASVLLGQCLGCLEPFYLRTSNKTDIGTNTNTKHVYDINARAVWGAMVTGGGCNSLNEQAASYDMPGMTRQTFSKIENSIGHMWEDLVKEEMLAAGCEERRLAVERNDFCDGIPAITVICDGGWSKRSHKHSYNALGGVGVIIGAATKKILFMGIRNKACYICKRAENETKQPKQHECFKNWTESSQAMEADVIVEGFSCAERMHGVRYMQMVGDGDSSVFARLQEEIPIWGSRIKKIECANHITKCLRTRLEQLVEDNPHYKGRNNLTKTRRVKIVATVRSSITYRNQHPSENFHTTVTLLQSDIMNAALHVFGIHDNCSDFCTIKQKQPASPACEEGQSTLQPDPPVEMENVMEETSAYWSEGMSANHQQLARCPDDEPLVMDPSLHRDIQVHLHRIAQKADKLIGDSTTNLAECWMAMRMKFDGGKVVNRCSRGSWGFRCYGALLRKNLGVNWAPITWEKTTGTRAGRAFREEYSRRSRHLQKAKQYQSTKLYKVRRWKRKVATSKSNLTKKAKLEYGPDSLDVTMDISKEVLQERMQYYYEKEVNVSQAVMQHIQQHTQEQSLSGYWVDERRKRLTASNFHQIVKRKPSIPVSKLVERLLYSTFSGTRLTRRGLRLEKSAILEYVQHKKSDGDAVEVKTMGLYVDRDHPFLGASVDGLVTSTTHGEGIIEIKHVLLNNLMSLQDAAMKSKSFCLEINGRMLKLKHSHAFYYQLQGQLNILQLPWVDLVVRRVEPHQLHIERIRRDAAFWNDVMLPKLKAFYHKALLPELAVPRHRKKPGIREPGIWYSPEVLRTRARSSKKRQQHSDTTVSSGSDSPAAPSHCTKKVSFLHQHILHEWLDEFGRSEWYSGLVLGLITGQDGDEDAEYEVIYEGADDKFAVDHLLEDFRSGSLKFID